MTFTDDRQSMRERIREWHISNFTAAFAPAKQVESVGYSNTLTLPLTERHARDEEFEEQKQAFQRIPAEIRERYHGRFVASCDGVIVDDDTDLASLTQRFRQHHGNVPVYITRIGKPARMPTPFLR